MDEDYTEEVKLLAFHLNRIDDGEDSYESLLVRALEAAGLTLDLPRAALNPESTDA